MTDLLATLNTSPEFDSSRVSPESYQKATQILQALQIQYGFRMAGHKIDIASTDKLIAYATVSGEAMRLSPEFDSTRRKQIIQLLLDGMANGSPSHASIKHPEFNHVVEEIRRSHSRGEIYNSYFVLSSVITRLTETNNTKSTKLRNTGAITQASGTGIISTRLEVDIPVNKVNMPVPPLIGISKELTEMHNSYRCEPENSRFLPALKGLIDNLGILTALTCLGLISIDYQAMENIINKLMSTYPDQYWGGLSPNQIQEVANLAFSAKPKVGYYLLNNKNYNFVQENYRKNIAHFNKLEIPKTHLDRLKGLTTTSEEMTTPIDFPMTGTIVLVFKSLSDLFYEQALYAGIPIAEAVEICKFLGLDLITTTQEHSTLFFNAGEYNHRGYPFLTKYAQLPPRTPTEPSPES